MQIKLSKTNKSPSAISFSKKVVGIDIDDRSIEVVMLEKKDGVPKVRSLSRIVMNFGIVENGRILDEKKLSKLLIKALERAKPVPIIKGDKNFKGLNFAFGLSDSQVYSQTFTFSTKKDLKKELDQETLIKIDKKVKANIPLESSDLLYSYKNIKKGDGKISVLVVATSKKVAKEWYSFFLNNGIKLKYFDSETMAIFRGLLIKESRLPVCIVDMGASSTLISIFDKSGQYYSYSMGVAGDKLTEEIISKEGVRHSQAEAYKRKYGLAHPDKKAFPIMIKILEPVVAEIKNALKFYQSHENKEISGIILTGGTSKLRGLGDYLGANLEKKIWFGNSKLIKEKSPLEHIESIGLALGGLDNKYSDLFLSYIEEVVENKSNFKKVSFKDSAKKYLSNLFSKDKSNPEEKKAPKATEKPSIKNTPLYRKILITFFIILLILLGFAFEFRKIERQKRESAIKSRVAQFTKTQQFRIEVPIAVHPSAYGDGRVKGRVITDTIELISKLNEVKEKSQTRATQSLRPNEILWKNSLNEVNRSNLVFPLEIKWLAFDENAASEQIFENLVELNTKKTEFYINEINNVNVAYTDNPNIMILISRVTLALDSPFSKSTFELKPEDLLGGIVEPPQEPITEELISADQIEEEAKELLEIEKPIVSVRVIDTGIGFLNVRSTPEITDNLVARIRIGETLTLLEDAGLWHKIKVNESQEGWVSSQYTEKVE